MRMNASQHVSSQLCLFVGPHSLPLPNLLFCLLSQNLLIHQSSSFHIFSSALPFFSIMSRQLGNPSLIRLFPLSSFSPFFSLLSFHFPLYCGSVFCFYVLAGPCYSSRAASLSLSMPVLVYQRIGLVQRRMRWGVGSQLRPCLGFIDRSPLPLRLLIGTF